MTSRKYWGTHQKLDFIIERLELMAVDQATFDAALTDFFADLDAGLAAISAALAAAGTPVDLSAELASVADAKTKFDAAVAADTAAAPPPAAPEPPAVV